LSTVSARAVDVDAKIILIDFEIGLISFWQNGNGDSRSVDTAARFCCGNALDTMNAGLVLEPSIRFVAADFENDLFVAANIRWAFRDELDTPAFDFGKTKVHSV